MCPTISGVDEDPKHRQVHIERGNRRAVVDAELASVILELWRLGIDTGMSCQDNQGRVLIEFPGDSDAGKFLNMLAAAGPDAADDLASLYNRMSGDRKPDDWDASGADRAWRYDVRPVNWAIEDGEQIGQHMFEFPISVRYPHSDHDEVLRRLRYVADAKDNELDIG
jgi:hypothetical protein